MHAFFCSLAPHVKDVFLPVQKTDVIVVHYCKGFTFDMTNMRMAVAKGSELEARLTKAAQVWSSDKQSLIVVCGGRGGWDKNVPMFFSSCSSVMKVFLVRGGVPNESILEESWSLNALESGAFTSKLLREKRLFEKLSCIVLVSHNVHMIRHGRIIAYFFPGVYVRACPIQDGNVAGMSEEIAFEADAAVSLEHDLTTKFRLPWEPLPQELADRCGNVLLVKKLSESSFEFKRIEGGKVKVSSGPGCSIAKIKHVWEAGRTWKVFGWKAKSTWAELRDDDKVEIFLLDKPVGAVASFGIVELLPLLGFAKHSCVTMERPRPVMVVSSLGPQPTSVIDLDAAHKLSPLAQKKLQDQGQRSREDPNVLVAQKVVKKLCVSPFFTLEDVSFFGLLSISEFENLCDALQSYVVSKKPSALAHLSYPVKIIGDIHGQLPDLLDLFRTFGFPTKYGGDIETTSYIFNGDFVDRGMFDLEVVVLLFSLAYLYPERIVPIRGNHEIEEIYGTYGFKQNCMKRLGPVDGERFLRSTEKIFSLLPLACLVSQEVLVLHGGIGSGDWELQKLENLKVPISSDVIRKDLVLTNILWSDPAISDSVIGEHANCDRGKGIVKFSAETVERFCQLNKVKLIVRSHQCVQAGYEYFANGRMVTVFSAANYMLRFGNSAALLLISKNPVSGECSCSAKVMRHVQVPPVDNFGVVEPQPVFGAPFRINQGRQDALSHLKNFGVVDPNYGFGVGPFQLNAGGQDVVTPPGGNFGADGIQPGFGVAALFGTDQKKEAVVVAKKKEKGKVRERIVGKDRGRIRLGDNKDSDGLAKGLKKIKARKRG